MKPLVTKEVTEHLSKWILLTIFIFLVGGQMWQMVVFHITLRHVTSMSSEHVAALKIYPGVIGPSEHFVEFTPPASIIDDFFRYAADLRSSWTNYSPASDEHTWFVEIFTRQGDTIQISCTIPIQKGHLVSIGQIDQRGFFKSQLLFQWYRQYSHLWLQPEESPPKQPHHIRLNSKFDIMMNGVYGDGLIL